MSLKDDFQNMAVDLINNINNFLSVSKVVTIIRPVIEDYDPVTGVIYEQSLNVSVNGIVSPWTADNSQGQTSDRVQTEDLKLLIAYKDLETLDEGTVSDEQKILPIRVNYDRIEIDNVEYNVTSLKLTAADALYILQLTKLVDPNPGN